MISIFKNKIFKSDNLKYIGMLIVTILGIVIVCLVNGINNKNKGLVINRVHILESFDKNKIGVYIDGEVNKAGYIKIRKGDTLEKAINKAGGITKKADIQHIDLKRVLKNQEKIIIPTIKEEYLDEKIDFEKYNENKVNINTATKEELMSLEGIGEKTAENIVKYRELNTFHVIEEIMEVKGIGENKFENIKDNICV